MDGPLLGGGDVRIVSSRHHGSLTHSPAYQYGQRLNSSGLGSDGEGPTPNLTVSERSLSYVESLRTRLGSKKVPTRKDVAEVAIAFVKEHEAEFLTYAKADRKRRDRPGEDES
jgi:hypothetical protein